MKPRMGDLETLFCQPRLAVKEQVEIDGARAPALTFAGSTPAALLLDFQQSFQQTTRRRIGVHREYRVEVRTLIPRTHGLGLIDPRCTDDPKPGRPSKRRPGVGEMRLALPQIGTQGDECAHSCCRHNLISIPPLGPRGGPRC